MSYKNRCRNKVQDLDKAIYTLERLKEYVKLEEEE